MCQLWICMYTSQSLNAVPFLSVKKIIGYFIEIKQMYKENTHSFIAYLLMR